MIFKKEHLRTLLMCAALGAGMSAPMWAPQAAAQTSLGTLTGTVRDASGAVIPDAKVTVTNQSTGDVRTATTSQLGAYRFDALPRGTYNLRVESKGFQGFDATGIQVGASVVQSYDPTLQPGQVSETVQVSADSAVLLDKENGSLSASIPSEAMAKLPIFSLNPIEVLTTIPGVQLVSNSQMSNGQSIQVSGARPRSNNFMIDGEEINDATIGGQAVQPNIPDMYADTVIYTHNAPAEFGRASGGVVNLITKGGSNTFHGSAWELYSGSGLNALDGQTRQVATDSSFKTRWNQHQYGFTAGGPVLKNKLFAFGAAQWSRYYGMEQASQIYLPNKQGIDTVNSIAASGSATASAQAKTLLNYLSQASYLSNFIDFGSYTDVGLGAACPASDPNCSMGVNLYRRPNAPISNPDTQWTYRIDYTPRSADTFTARYLHDRNSLSPDFFTNGSALPGFDTEQAGPSELGQGTWTHIFTSSLLNEFRVAETRLHFYFQPTAETLKNPLYTAPTLVFDDLSNLGFDQSFPQGRGQDMYQFQDTISWTHGRHTIRAGVDIGRRIEKDLVSLNAHGQLTFVSGGSGDSAEGNFLLNQLGPSGQATKTFGSTRMDPHSWRSGAFVQDDFKFNSDLTLNLGIRYDYFTSPENILPYPAIDVNNPSAPIDTVFKVKNDRNNFAPRIGFAYTPHNGPFADGKTVVRGGFGVFYDSDFTNIAINEAQSSPNAVSGLLTSTTGDGLDNAMNLIGQISPQLSPYSSVTSVDKNLVSPYSLEYNLGVERELPWQIGLSVTYAGSRGVKLFANQQYNPINPAATPTARYITTRGVIMARGNYASSSYNGLEIGAKRNFSKGLAIYGSYVYSKTLDNGSEVFTTDSQPTSYAADLNPGGRQFEWGNSAYDHRHYGAITYVWNPAGFRVDNRGADAVLSALTRHWTISGTSRFQTGAYSTVNFSGWDSNRDGSAVNDRPILSNRTAPMNTAGVDGHFVHGATGTYYDVASWNSSSKTLKIVDPNSVHWLIPWTVGYVPQEIGRNSFRNPGALFNDVALEKAIPTSLFHLDRGQFVFRAEAQDIANHNNVGLLDVNLKQLGTAGFMNTQQARLSTGGSSNRSIRLWAKFVF